MASGRESTGWGPSPADEEAARKRATKNVSKVAAGLGLTEAEVRAAFHPLKSETLGHIGPGAINNPDVWVDPETGWAFPQLGAGTLGECVANIREYLDE